MSPQAFYFDTVDSTNEVAKRLMHDGSINDVAYIVAATQTAGKGTHGRSWISPPHAGLYLSVVHPGPYPLSPLLTLAAGVACAEALHPWAPTVALKPINDLMAHGCKLGGILTESLFLQGKTQALITGIGINLKDVARDVAPSVAGRVQPPAISLEALLSPEAWGAFSQEQLVTALVSGVDTWYARLLQGQTEAVYQRWKEYQLPGTELPSLEQCLATWNPA